VVSATQLSDEVQELFAACHGLTQLGDTVVGDPLDQRLFEASGYDMRFEEDPPPAVVPPFSEPTADGAPTAAVAVFTGPYLMLRRRPAGGLPLPVSTAAGYAHGADLRAGSGIHASLLVDTSAANATSPRTNGGGAGVLGALGRLGMQARQSFDSGPGGVSSPRFGGVESTESHQHPSHVDPRHAPIHLAKEHFSPQDALVVLRWV
jgi:hypothetical protein